MAVTRFRDDQMAGEVQGPASSTDNAIARFDGTGGKTIQNSPTTVTDSGYILFSNSANIGPDSTNQLEMFSPAGNQYMTLNDSNGVYISSNVEATMAHGSALDSITVRNGEVDLLSDTLITLDAPTTVLTGTLDLNGTADALILDADGDSHISAENDDQIEIATGGGNRVRVGNSLIEFFQAVQLYDGASLVAGTFDANGTADAFVLDTDGDTTISAPTDDQIDIEIAGADDFRFTTNTFTALEHSAIETDTIAETTAGSGVTVDGVLVKDGQIEATYLQAIYPVGSIYIETTGTNPGTTFGFGTWAAFGSGKVLVGLDSGDTDFDTAEETGGSKTHSHPLSDNGQALVDGTANDIRVHRVSTASSWNADIMNESAGTYTSTNESRARATGLRGDTDSADGMNPYIVVYMWKRTA